MDTRGTDDYVIHISKTTFILNAKEDIVHDYLEFGMWTVHFSNQMAFGQILDREGCLEYAIWINLYLMTSGGEI